MERRRRRRVIGAGVTYTRIVREMAEVLPGLAIASRTVGSPQIRNRGTVGGNVATSSPAGDALPPLIAVGRRRRARVGEPARAASRSRSSAPAPSATSWRRTSSSAPSGSPPPAGPSSSRRWAPERDGHRRLLLRRRVRRPDADRRHGHRLGGAHRHPGARGRGVPARASSTRAATGRTARRCPTPRSRRFGELVGEAARPIDDVRGTADYRRHALSVIGRRTAAWCWEEHAP